MAINIIVPDLGESVIEATVARWLKKEGDMVNVGEPVVVLETDKVDLEVGADRGGVLAKIDQPAGADVKIGDVLGSIEESAGTAPAAGASAAPSAPAPVSKPAPAPASAPAAAPVAASATPVARRVAEDQQVDLGRVEASSGGRVTKADVERFVEGQKATPAALTAAPTPMAAPATVPISNVHGRAEERVKMSRRRRTIAQRLVEAQHTAAMLTTFNEIDMTGVQQIREKHKERFKTEYGIGLGLSSFFVKAVIGALKTQPRLNSELQGDEVVLKHYYDIGMAIGAEEGLVVPVIRDADKLSFGDIEKAIKKFAAQANDGSLSLDSLRGGTFTITNGGVFGSLMSTPILNPPQVAILGLHKIQQRPVAVNGEVVIRPMMYTALSYDHRVVDGREAVQFLVRVKDLLEDPERLLIEG